LIPLLHKSKKLEIDVSKYDKSQRRIHLLVETKIFKLLGLPEYICNLWITAHTHTQFSNSSVDVSGEILYQRKSGDAATFFGNTIVLMASLCILYDLSETYLCMFAGDDSLLFFHPNTTQNLDKNKECAEVFQF